MRIFAAYTILTLSRVICLSQAVTTTRREFEPLTTVFTPAPECASLTIVHYGRKVLVRTGCVRPDPSCCPPVAPTNTTYSPGICPSGYSTYDAHLGVDRLGIDTKTWEATCIPRYGPPISSMSRWIADKHCNQWSYKMLNTTAESPSIPISRPRLPGTI